MQRRIRRLIVARPERRDVTSPPETGTTNRLLPILLAMAMFVLVVDTSIMNVSISAVVADLGTDVSAIQAAIALEALVSAAFILIGSKIGDLFGRKRAYVLGLLAYAIGALAMALGQSVTAVFILWAVIGGLGASLLLPAMQSLIHGNFEGSGPEGDLRPGRCGSAAIAAAVGPLIGGFITTFLSYRVAFLLEVVIIAIVLSGIRLVRDAPYTGPRQIDLVGCAAVGPRHGRPGAGHPRVAGGRRSRRPAPRDRRDLPCRLAYWLMRRKRAGKPTLIDPLFDSKLFRLGISGQVPPEHRARWHDDHHPDLPADGLGIQRAAGGPVAGPALAQHVRDGDPRRQAGGSAAASSSSERDSRSCWSDWSC